MLVWQREMYSRKQDVGRQSSSSVSAMMGQKRRAIEDELRGVESASQGRERVKGQAQRQLAI